MSDKEQRIRVRAYAIWEGEGRHDGRTEERWRQAELEIEQALRSAEAQAAEAPEQPPKAAGNRARTSIGPIDRIVPAMIEADRHQALRPPTEKHQKAPNACGSDEDPSTCQRACVECSLRS